MQRPAVPWAALGMVESRNSVLLNSDSSEVLQYLSSLLQPSELPKTTPCVETGWSTSTVPLLTTVSAT